VNDRPDPKVPDWARHQDILTWLTVSCNVTLTLTLTVPVLTLTKHYAMKASGRVDLWIHVFLSSALVGGEWSASRPCHLIPGERAPGTHWTGAWVGPTAGVEDMDKWKFLTLLGLELRPLNCNSRKLHECASSIVFGTNCFWVLCLCVCVCVYIYI
jgi:hypothetical protein